MATIKEQKAELRKQIKLLKQEQAEEDKKLQSELIFKKLEQLTVFKSAETIMLYWSMVDEVITHEFIEKWWQMKTILLPVVDGNILKIRQYSGKNSLVNGEQFGIPEPTGPEFKKIEKIDIIVVPGVAFDRQNNRMGRGGGFYDKLLATTKAFKIGVCYNFQLIESVPVEDHDFCMDKILSS